MQGMNLYTYLTPYAKINSKCIKNLKVRVRAIKLLEENIGVNLYDLGLGDSFLNTTQRVQATK